MPDAQIFCFAVRKNMHSERDEPLVRRFLAEQFCFLSRRIFGRILPPDFFSSFFFVGKGIQKNLRGNPWQNRPNFYKHPRHMSPDWPGQTLVCSSHMLVECDGLPMLICWTLGQSQPKAKRHRVSCAERARPRSAGAQAAGVRRGLQVMLSRICI